MERKLVLKKEWCKGCSICVEFCPKDVLALEENKISIKDKESCILCNMCGQMCPDFAISVESTKN